MKNFCRFEIKSLNQERLLNELSKKVTIYGINRKSKEITSLNVKPKDRKQVEEFFLKNRVTIISKENKGLYFSFAKFFHSYGIISGFVVGLILYIIQSFFVVQFEVWGNETIQDKTIIDYVKQNLQTRYSQDIDTKQIEIELFSNFENLSFVSVAIVGQTMIINVKESLEDEELQNDFNPIVAEEDGMITSVELIQGTLCVEVGNVVKKGDLLVAPYFIDANGEQKSIQPKANIYADTWITETQIHNSSYEEIYRTGNYFTNSEIYLCNLKIYENKKENNYVNFEVEKTTDRLIKNNLLPFFIKKTTYFEISTRLVEVQFEEVKEKIIDEERENVLQKIKDYEIIKKENVSIKQAGNLTTVSYTATINKKIGE